MNDNVKEFNNLYKKIATGINDKLDEYNKFLVKGKKGYLKDNLEIFTNLNSSGKLVRGFLIALGYYMTGKDNIEYSYDLSLAYEVLQTSVLIHDDIIDEDNLRRGKETIHYANYKKYKMFNEKDAKKVSESIGICVGDYGFYEANKLIINSYHDNPNFAKILDYYNDIVLKTIEGELTDVVTSFDGKYNIRNTKIEDNIMLVYKLKTAYYTITGPLSLGLLLGGTSSDKLKEIEKIGENIGIAFQIQDDILGIYNDLGKNSGSDIREYKQTLLFSKTIENEKYKKELLKYYGKENVTSEDIENVRKLFKESGAYNYANNLMNELYVDAEELIKNNKWLKDEYKSILLGFIEYLKMRIK